MAVIKVTPRFEGRGGGVDPNGVETLAREWLIETDDPTDDVPQVIAAVPVQLYDPHPKNPLALARSVEVKQHAGQTVWHVRIPYSTGALAGVGSEPTVQDPANPQQPQPQSQTPAQDRPPTWSFTRKENREAAEYDGTGKRYANTNGERLVGIERVYSTMLITIKFWSLKITTAHLERFWDTVNEAAWKGFGPRTLKVLEYGTSWSYDKVGESAYGLVCECSVQLEWNRREWRRKVLNTGTRYRKYDSPSNTGSFQEITVTDDTGQPASEPVPLNEDGTRWTGGPFHYVYFDDHPLDDFAQLIPAP